MRQVRTATFISLDGVMQGPGGPDEDPTGGFPYGGWVAPHFDEAMGSLMDQAMGEDYDLLLGRKTYEIFAGHWPHYDDEIGRKFNSIAKYVACAANEPLPWKGSVRLGDDVPAAVASLKADDGPDLLIQGSSVLIQSLLAHNLIDQITTLMCPVILGTGKRLFEDSAQPRTWALSHSQATPGGVVVSTYRRAGEVQTGDFSSQAPSPEELARRERWSREG